MKVGKVILWNLLGIVLGLLGGGLAQLVSQWLMLSVLPEIPLITSLLSWPVDYSVYALVAIVSVDILAAAGIASFFGEFGNTHINFAVVVVSLVNAVRYISNLVTNISESGFSFGLLVVYVVAFGAIVFAFMAGVSEKE